MVVPMELSSLVHEYIANIFRALLNAELSIKTTSAEGKNTVKI